MRVMYVARFGNHDNADEEAIKSALRELGVDVVCYDSAKPPTVVEVMRAGPDLLLTHKWDDVRTLSTLPCPKAFWFFDLVESDDFMLKDRSAERVRWVQAMTAVCEIGFMTDGDWVANDKTGKLNWLMQGADERVAGIYDAFDPGVKPADIVFTGTTIHGGKRLSFVEEMKATYGDRFLHFGEKSRDRLHGKPLGALLARCKVVVAPDGPVSDRYWSNRVYQALGFGAFLLHPYCVGLAHQYETGKHLFLYHDRDHLHALLRDVLQDAHWANERRVIAAQGFRHTLERHTYRHRVLDLIRTVEVKLGRGK